MFNKARSKRRERIVKRTRVSEADVKQSFLIVTMFSGTKKVFNEVRRVDEVGGVRFAGWDKEA